jgi:hypothetical protein
MLANPLRRRSKLADVAKLAAADAALSYAKDRFTPGSRKRGRGKAMLLGGAVVAVGAAAYANRKRVAGLLGAGPSVPEPPPYSPPQTVTTPQPVAASQPVAAPVSDPQPSQPEVPQPVTQTEIAAAETTPTTPSTPETPAAGDPQEREEAQRDEGSGPGWQTWSGISSKP